MVYDIMKVTCSRTGKHTYGTREGAIREAERMTFLSGRAFRAYCCEFCHFWHITSKPWRRQRRP
jgi:hypothetical protein